MYFDSLQAALQMDGHGAYVWVAYGITALVLTQLLVWPFRGRQRLLRELRAEQRRKEARGRSVAETEIPGGEPS
jgi:heme exporter protein D